ncbi:MAG: biotin/lipoyl-containing protein [Pseudomonadota bacterium]
MEKIVAPIPGMVSSISVKVGQAVKPDQPVLILEAMKMMNEIYSSSSGTVKEILVSEGSNVTVNQAMIIIE